ncbi:acetyl-CoA synthetase-like protein [Viridothelium virens]|uniref:Acetyl-CoA synthetase-like protein n=1 Tax=Viridothelium virens TaxID=1048519 RepID=A0A6A6HDA0_VIRVR|nr:acetyl-CoA synthetase-like protein [Viridothelium virens]
MASNLKALLSSHGRRLIPALIDEIAQKDGNRPFISIPVSSKLQDGYADVTFAIFAAAVDRTCWWLEETLDRSRASNVLFYIGPLDVRYLILMVAANKTGYVAFFSSHRNSLEAHLSLLDATNCSNAILAEGAPAVVKQILAKRAMDVSYIPNAEFLLRKDELPANYPFQRAFDDAKDDTFVVLHTSGSTGIPKPVFVTHGTFASNDAYQLIPSRGGKPTFIDFLRGKRLFVSMPIFHAANLGMVMISIFAGFTCVLPPAGPMNADQVDLIHTYGNVDGSLCPPSLLVDIYNEPKYLQNMVRRLDFAAYVGGTLATEVGGFFSHKLKLITLFGTTENMYFPLEVHDKPVNWQYMQFSSFLGHSFRDSTQDLGELVIVRDSEKSLWQGIFSTFPGINEYGTKDLYEQHPDNKSLRRFSRRSDDIICFNNAEKLNPITMETIISTHQAIESAIIGGNGQFQACLLIEPKSYPANPAEARHLIEQIWPTILEANKDCPAHGRIVKDFIVLTTRDKPLPKAGKTTVQRSAALQLYAKELEALYTKFSSSMQTKTTTQARSSSQQRGLNIPHTQDEQIIKLEEDDDFLLPDSTDGRIERVLKRVLPSILAHALRVVADQMFDNGASPFFYDSTVPSGTLGSRGSGSQSHQTLPDAQLDKLGDPRTTISDPIKNAPLTPPSKGSHNTDTRNEMLREGLYSALANSTFLPNVADDENLFNYGLDSIQMVSFIRNINEFFERSTGLKNAVHSKIVYENPSIKQLVGALQTAT